MSYTTGEIAKLCGVTVRTVQFYDKEGLLTPDGHSEGGRRLYGEESLKTLQIICTYKSFGFSLNEIKRVISDEAGRNELLLAALDERERELGAELENLISRRDSIRVFKERLESGAAVSPETLYDVQKIMESKKKYKATLIVMGVFAALSVLADIAFIVIGAVLGEWLPLAIGMPVIVAGLTVMIWAYHKNVAYICRDCGKKFTPKFWAMFFAAHTPKTRKLTCPHCGSKKYHLETYRDE